MRFTAWSAAAPHRIESGRPAPLLSDGSQPNSRRASRRVSRYVCVIPQTPSTTEAVRVCDCDKCELHLGDLHEQRRALIGLTEVPDDFHVAIRLNKPTKTVRE